MDDVATPTGGGPGESIRQDGLAEKTQYVGVRGWLLVLCVMLTVVGPFISFGLMAKKYAELAPSIAGSGGLELMLYASFAIKLSIVAYGVYAGVRLWSIQPDAVNTAKRALLFGLAAGIVATAVQVAVGPESNAHVGLLRDVMRHFIPSLVFFTICFAYLNKSTRVHATYHARHKHVA